MKDIFFDGKIFQMNKLKFKQLDSSVATPHSLLMADLGKDLVWANIGTVNPSDIIDRSSGDNRYLRLAGGSLYGPINFNKGNDISSISPNLALSNGNYFVVTGTTNITAFGTIQAGSMRYMTFADVLTLVNSASLILPGGSNIKTNPGDSALFVSLGAGVWKCLNYFSTAYSSYKQSFTYADLTDGQIVITHGLQERVPAIQVWGSDFSILTPDNIVSVDINNIMIDLTSYGSFTGEYFVKIVK